MATPKWQWMNPPQQASAQDKSILKCATAVRNGKALATAMPSDGNAMQWQFQAAALLSSSTTNQRHYQPAALPTSSKTKHASGNDSTGSETQNWRTILNATINLWSERWQWRWRHQQQHWGTAAMPPTTLMQDWWIAFPVHSSCHAAMAMASAHLWLEFLEKQQSNSRKGNSKILCLATHGRLATMAKLRRWRQCASIS